MYVNHFSKALTLDKTNTESKYGLLLAEGRALVKKGNKNGIWDAIEKYSKASNLFPSSGEPFYLTAIAYTKLGDTDFDLILESYEKSIEFTQTPNSHIKHLIVSFTSDWLFPTIENKAIVETLNSFSKQVSFIEIETDKGHDSFLLNEPSLDFVIRGFLENNLNKLV